MTQENRDTLSVLRSELAFLQLGGYHSPEQAAWRPQFIFEDSPTCLNFRNLGKRIPCSHCALMDFVPNGFKQERFPCRHISLDDSGHTLDSLYRTATEEEAHAVVANWLRTTIAQLEREQASSGGFGGSANTRAFSAAHS